MNASWKLILWLLAGVLLPYAAFYLLGSANDHWASLNIAVVVSTVFLIVLLGYFMRSPFSIKTRIITWTAFVLVVAIGTIGWRGMEDLSKYQRRTLMEIRSVITNGILKGELYTPLQKTLAAYYGQTGKKKETLGQVFQQLYPAGKVGENIHDVHQVDPKGDDSLRVVVTSVSNNEIGLVGYHYFSRGRNKEFKNYNGRFGFVQAKAVLSEKGYAMNQKTDQNNISTLEFSPKFLRWISITTLGTLLIVLVPTHQSSPFTFNIFYNPTFLAMGMTISMGFSEFSGHIPSVNPIDLFTLITALVLLYIIGPVLWLYSWRVLKLKKAAGTPIMSIARGWSLLFIIGGALTCRTVFFEIISTIGNQVVSARLHNAQNVQSSKDCLINNLYQVSFEANDYRILPKSLSGGSGSYEGFCISPQQVKNDNGEFSIIRVRPQMITFLAVSSKNTANTIMVSVDSIGQTCHWAFSGDYE